MGLAEENPWLTYVKDYLNVEFEYLWITESDGNSYNTKWNLGMASGELPTVAGVNRTTYEALVAADLVADMSNAIDQYASDQLKKFIYSSVEETYFGGMDRNVWCTGGFLHTAGLTVWTDGRNSIMVVPGSNSLLSCADMEVSGPIFKEAKIVGFQLETPLDAVVHGIHLAHEMGAKTLLDPAPACPLSEEIYSMLTYIKLNAVEASTITGIPVTDVESARRAGEWLGGKGVKHAIVTFGKKGAGDCFSGVLMAMLAEGCRLDDAIRIAVRASAVSTTCMGVVESQPHRGEVEALCRAAGEAFP